MRNLILMLMLVMSISSIVSANDIIEDPYKIYENYRLKVKEKIESCEKEFNKTDDTVHKRDMDETIKQLNDILEGLGELERSTVVYTAVYSDALDSTKGYTVIGDGNKVVSVLGRSVEIQEVVGHEIRHQVQYEWQEISLLIIQPSELNQKKNWKYGVLHDITDEADAYRMARLIKGKASENKCVNNRWTRRQLKVYRKLPRCPINLLSREGKALRKRTASGNASGQSFEYYKGWQADASKSAIQ